jgi:glycerol-3-phosphate dehydrogenase
LTTIELDNGVQDQRLEQDVVRRLQGRYGAAVSELLATAHPDELELIPGTPYLWAEMRWAARSEYVVHLEDLLARRLRLSLLLPDGGEACFPRIKEICRQELGWDDAHWMDEQARYLHYWRTNFGLPEGVPDWRGPLRAAQAANLRRYRRRRKQAMGSVVAVALTGAVVSGAIAVHMLSRWTQNRGRDRAAVEAAASA